MCVNICGVYVLYARICSVLYVLIYNMLNVGVCHGICWCAVSVSVCMVPMHMPIYLPAYVRCVRVRMFTCLRVLMCTRRCVNMYVI